MLLHGFTADSVVLEVEESRGTLDVGHVAGRCALQSSEDLAASQYPLKLSDKLVEMVLDNAVQIDKLSVDVVEYLYFGRLRP